MDLFLASCNTARQHLQLVGAVCLHVSSKVRQVHPIATETLIYYTDNSVTAMDILVSVKINFPSNCDVASSCENNQGRKWEHIPIKSATKCSKSLFYPSYTLAFYVYYFVIETACINSKIDEIFYSNKCSIYSIFGII